MRKRPIPVGARFGATAPMEATGAPRTQSSRGSFRIRVLIVPILLLLWEGLPLSLMGEELTTTRYGVAAILLFGFGLFFIKFLKGQVRFDSWTILAATLVGWNVFVSLISNTLIFPQPLNGWLFALYETTPILLVFLLRELRLSTSEVIDAIVWTSAGVVAVTIYDHFSPIDVLTRYTRFAYADPSLRRLVMMKTEISISLGLAIVRLTTARSIRQIFVWGTYAAIVTLSLFVITESRLTVAAVLIANTLFVLLMLRGRTRVTMIVLGIVISLTVLPILLEKYIDYFESKGNFTVEDKSVAWRIKTLEFYYDYFEQTNGLGFGVMSTGPDKDNILSFATTKAGALVGSMDYNFYMADLGIMGALVQFGWVGLAIVLLLNLKAIHQMVKIGRRGNAPNHLEIGMVGLVMFAYLLSPWPTNFFTLQWSALSGGFMWAIAAISASEARALSIMHRAQQSETTSFRKRIRRLATSRGGADAFGQRLEL